MIYEFLTFIKCIQNPHQTKFYITQVYFGANCEPETRRKNLTLQSTTSCEFCELTRRLGVKKTYWQCPPIFFIFFNQNLTCVDSFHPVITTTHWLSHQTSSFPTRNDVTTHSQSTSHRSVLLIPFDIQFINNKIHPVKL